MTPWDDLEDEMRGPLLDDDIADRLLSGLVEPDDAPPGYAGVARLLRAADSSPTAGELHREKEAVAAAARAVRAQRRYPLLPTTRRPTVRSRFFRAKVAGLVVVGTFVGTTGLAAAGVLPDAAQNAVSNVLSKVGISVPSGDEHPASTGSDISTIATTTGSTGVDKGAEISSTASGGMSQAGLHGPPEGTSGSTPPVATPNEGGTRTAETASGGASDSGTATANEASQGHSAAGSANDAGTPTAPPTAP